MFHLSLLLAPWFTGSDNGTLWCWLVSCLSTSRHFISSKLKLNNKSLYIHALYSNMTFIKQGNLGQALSVYSTISSDKLIHLIRNPKPKHVTVYLPIANRKKSKWRPVSSDKPLSESQLKLLLDVGILQSQERRHNFHSRFYITLYHSHI
jgi:hypothetical protein